MAKLKTIYLCSECGAPAPKWSGQCSECHAWNSIVEDVIAIQPKKNLHKKNFLPENSTTQIKFLSDIPLNNQARHSTQFTELDRVLGGGLVPGAVILIGGAPGIGKSTLLLQMLAKISRAQPALYISGEESLQQISHRATRLGISSQSLKLLASTEIESILNLAQNEKPQVMVIDSIQTMATEFSPSAPGTIGQIRQSASQLVQYAKQTNTILFIVGHVTKEGTIAGPRLLEHMVDTVLYFEGDRHSRFRIIRAVKNRFGAVNELGIFAMTDMGLREVNNPSAIFLSHYDSPTAGSTVLVTWEGSRPMLVEIQALVDESHLANPRRITVGLEQNRLAMLLAVLNRHGKIVTYNQDVFVNAVGGVRVIETAADLAIVLAVMSSLTNRPLPRDLVIFGEVGLAGEIRPVQNGEARLLEAKKHGFKRAIIPKANMPKSKKKFDGLTINAVQHLKEALNIV